VFLLVEDYPRDLLELEARFSTEAACEEYLVRLRWPAGFRCDRCGGQKAWSVSGARRDRWECAACHGQVALTAGTIFQDSRLPLTLWFRAVWWVTSQKNGVSAMGLQRILGLKSYKTAWTMLHKLRHAMVRPGRDRLIGRVEADEAFVGGEEEGVHGRQRETKAMVAVAVEKDGRRGIGRIRMRRIPDASAESLMPFIQDSVEPGSVVRTDGWLGYVPLEGNGYKHEIVFLKGGNKTASELMPRVHLAVALLKRWLLGTHQGGVSLEHLDAYLDEFTFRFNRRKSRSRGKLFYRLLEQAVAVEPVPYKSLVKCSVEPDF
jgi:transposase-like protein